MQGSLSAFTQAIPTQLGKGIQGSSGTISFTQAGSSVPTWYNCFCTGSPPRSDDGFSYFRCEYLLRPNLRHHTRPTEKMSTSDVSQLR